MSEHKPMPVAGYTSQSDEKLTLVNRNKRLEEIILRQIDEIQDGPVSFDPRWLSLARTQIELGFMALNRAVFMPTRIELPEDTEGG